jgi:hypothetical protein
MTPLTTLRIAARPTSKNTPTDRCCFALEHFMEQPHQDSGVSATTYSMWSATVFHPALAAVHAQAPVRHSENRPIPSISLSPWISPCNRAWSRPPYKRGRDPWHGVNDGWIGLRNHWRPVWYAYLLGHRLHHQPVAGTLADDADRLGHASVVDRQDIGRLTRHHAARGDRCRPAPDADRSGADWQDCLGPGLPDFSVLCNCVPALYGSVAETVSLRGRTTARPQPPA